MKLDKFTRKYKIGSNPCYFCFKSHHSRCRGMRLDQTICSCTCKTKVNFNKEIRLYQELAQEKNIPLPGVLEIRLDSLTDKKKKILEKKLIKKIDSSTKV